MKTPVLFAFFALLFGALAAQAQNPAYNGYWVTPGFTNVHTANGIDKQKMLLCIQPMPGSNGTLYRVYYYLWNKDFVSITGPVFENGFFDADSGWLYLGKGDKGRDILKLEGSNLFYFLNNNPAAGAKTTILNMTKVDDANGLQLEAIIKKKKAGTP